MLSAHEFIRALKSPPDPPTPGGPTKIELAANAWNDHSFSLPNKPQVIIEWILGRLAKDKGKRDGTDGCVYDNRYWSLLSAVLTSQKTSESRSLKTWLNPILQNISFPQIVTTLLEGLPTTLPNGAEELFLSVNDCATVLWTPGTQRTTVEFLLETLGIYLKHASTWSYRPFTSPIGQLIATSYHQTLVKSSNRRKLFSSFLKSHLPGWLIYANASSDPLPDQDAVINAGLETFFNLDVLRQNQDSMDENPLFSHLQEALKTAPAKAVLNTLPVLFSSFIKSNRVYQGALYSQGSKGTPGAMLEGVRSAGMQFFSSCQQLLNGLEKTTDWWKTQEALLRLVNSEHLLSQNATDAKTVLLEFMEGTIAALRTSPQTSSSDPSEKIECLALLAEIDYDLVAPSVPRILVRFCSAPQGNGAAFKFLGTVLDYHSKTRTLDILVDDMSSAILDAEWVGNLSVREYPILLSSPPLDATYLRRLDIAFRNLITPRQCASVTQNVCDRLHPVWRQFRSTMKQDEDTNMDSDANPPPYVPLAIQLSLLCRFASVVLSSLPLQPLPEEMVQEVRTIVQGFASEILQKMVSSCLKWAKRDNENGAWAASVVATAALRLAYALMVSPNFKDIEVMNHDASSEKTLKTAKRNGILPELFLESTRILLLNAYSTPLSSLNNVLDPVLTFIETHLSNQIAWSGQEQDLSTTKDGQAKCALALLHLLMDRWVFVVEENASSINRTRILKLLFRAEWPISNSPHGMTAGDLLTQVIHSAQFWELRNFRESFLELLDEDSKAISSGQSPAHSLALYRTLLLVPTEYFPHSNLGSLLQSAVKLDQSLLLTGLDDRQIQDVVFLRLFLARGVEHLTSIPLTPDRITSYLLYLQSTTATLVSAPATLNLVGLLFKHLIRRVQNGDPTPLLKAIPSIRADALSTARGLSLRTFMELVDVLSKDIPKAGVHEDVLRTLEGIASDLFSPLSADMDRLSSIDLTGDNVQKAELLISLWCRVLTLEKWLGFPHASAVPMVGRSLATQLLRKQPSDESLLANILESAFGTLVQELEFYPADNHEEHLDLIAASYVSFSKLNASLSSKLDTRIIRAIRSLLPADFAHLILIVSGALFSNVPAPHDVSIILVHLSDLLLRNHPQNTLVHLQKFINKCVNGFCNNTVFSRGPIDLRLHVLDLLAQYCLDQQAALRPVDVAGIWSFLGAILAPSKDHDKATEPRIFHRVIAVLSPLIRLRRDLISPTLPLLGSILRRLMLCLRACRPNLGAKQSAIVMDTQPRWIHEKEPLKAEEAKALARLIESLTTKTVVRILTSSKEEHKKAESLAKPFSKHAAYVLKAYIEAMNDPLCVLPLEVRTELQPGLFALCGMMNEHSRDALMVSALDTGGKATMKAVWKAYEKQRYVGKG